MRLLVFLLCLVLSLAACDQQDILEHIAPKEEAALSKQTIAQVAARDFAPVEAGMDDSLRSPGIRDTLEQMANMVPKGQPKNVTLVGAKSLSGPSFTRYELTYEYEYPDAWFLANTVIERRAGKDFLMGIHFAPRTQSLESEFAFSLAGKSLAHYLLSALAIAVAMFILYAFVACIRTPIPKRKWLWLLFIAFGVMQLQFNWTTGDWDVQPLSILLFGAGIFRGGPGAPWILELGVPLGAIAFLSMRKEFAPPVRPASDEQPT